jgi:cysteine desulfurase
MTGARAIYLDHNATAPVLPAVAAAVADALSRVGNPSSVHGFGRAARRAVEHARAEVAALVGVPDSWVVFTSGGTEANDLALNGVVLNGISTDRILVSAVEHDSVLRAAANAARVPVDRSGIIDLSALDAALAGSGAALVSVMLANNETGVIQPIARVVEIAHRHGAVVHCDAVQAAGRIEVDMKVLGVDLMTLSAHKLGGPTGIGALIVHDGVRLAARLRGGGQERWRRAGTENVAGIVGFGIAAAAARQDRARMAEFAALRDSIERGIRDIAPEAPIYGSDAPRLANTSCVGMPGVKGETQVMAFDWAGIAVSAGAACSSGKVTPSEVLKAMGADDKAAAEAIRVSLGAGNTAEHASRFVAEWKTLYDRTRRLKAAA